MINPKPAGDGNVGLLLFEPVRLHAPSAIYSLYEGEGFCLDFSNIWLKMMPNFLNGVLKMWERLKSIGQR